MMKLMAALLAVLLLALAPARGQDLTPRAGPQAKPVCIINATVHTVSGETIENGYVYFVGGVIQALGREPLPRFREAPEFVDAKGLHVYPGMISAYTQLGITEIGALRQPNDTNEFGQFAPEALAATALNPDSWLLPVTRVNGVLAAGVFPVGGLIPGRASVIHLDGWTSEDLQVRRDAGVIVAWPLMRPVRARWSQTPEGEQLKNIKENVERIRTFYERAVAYRALRQSDPATPVDLRYEAMIASLPPLPTEKREQSLTFFEASDYDQIVAAVAFAVEQRLRPVIVGGRDAPLCADLLTKHDVPVIVNSVLLMPKRDDSPYDEVYSIPARLQAAGVRFCIASGEETPHERNLPYAAGMAAAHGLDHDAAIKAITLWPAEILGVSTELGSLEVGKSATLIVTTGDPLEVTSQVVYAYIDGRAITLSTKQTELAKKYREKYRQQGEHRGAADPAPGR